MWFISCTQRSSSFLLPVYFTSKSFQNNYIREVEPFFKKVQSLSIYPKIFTHFMQTEWSSPCSQQPAIYLCLFAVYLMVLPVATSRSQRPCSLKEWVCGRSLAGIACSIPAGGTKVCPLWVSRVVRYRSLRRADHLPRGVLPSVVCLSVMVSHR
jgi:hypothetical protein